MAAENYLDKGKKRATFNVAYPNQKTTINQDFYEINLKGKREKFFTFKDNDIIFEIGLKNFNKLDFKNCRFNYDGGKSIIELSDFTFKNCNFHNCFLGSCEFKYMKFDNCTFTLCDFMNSKFDRSLFKDCNFDSCSAMYLKIELTEIAPNSFLNSLIFFHKHYLNDEKEKMDDFEKFNSNKLQLAKSIYRSNDQLASLDLVDESLFHLKKLELKNMRRKFDCGQWESWKNLAFPIIFSKINFIISKGGTSLTRLFGVGLIIWILFTIIFSFSSIQMNVDNEPIGIGFSFSKTFSIFLGFGFTGFYVKTITDFFAMVICAGLGILWYAIAIPVLIRKMHR